ncbi:hypothetical protein [Gracilibacillus xinjiangensis]|uniref:Uncharacterized protein n=1 Tax=Gracilibacillus xinjiangensis TaxID=1193282 RepID=A0ABV8WRJ1_9BACI
MGNKKTDTEKANIKINEVFNKENKQNLTDIDSLINNNNISLVIKGQDDK